MLRTARAELVDPSVLRLDGVVTDEDVRRELDRVFEEADAYVLASKLPAITLDVRALAYANSSAIRVFIDMVSRAERGGYRLIVEIDESVTWHRLNFSVLQTLSPHVVELRDAGRSCPGR